MSQQDNYNEYESSSGSGHHSSSGHHHSSSHSSSGHHHSSSHSSSGHHHSSSSRSSSGSSHHSSSGHHHSGSGYSSHSSHGSSHSSSSSEQSAEKFKKLSEKYSSADEKEDVYFSTTPVKPTSSVVASNAVRKQKKKKKNKALSVILGILIFFFSLLIVASVALFVMISAGKKDMLDYQEAEIEVIPDAESDDDGKTVKYNGKIYQLDENITSIACLGVDNEEINQDGVVGAAGQADTIAIIALDTETGEAKIIPIPRDSIAEIDVYAKDGSFLRTEKTQICLAYAYGDGGKTSCANVISAIKKTMFGMPIHCYAALDLSGIGPINDSVGGVTVVPQDSFGDFSAGDPYHLMGSQAMAFVRFRDTSKVDSNLTRMNHQLIYIKSFTKTAASQIIKKPAMVSDVYNVAARYSYTDIDLSKASFIVSKFMSAGTAEFEPVSVPGEMILGDDGYSEYHIDKKKFYETILSVYYDVIGTY